MDQLAQSMTEVTRRALEDSTSDYEMWKRNQAFQRALRQGRVQFVVHTGMIANRHVHIHYDGGKLPDFE